LTSFGVWWIVSSPFLAACPPRSMTLNELYMRPPERRSASCVANVRARTDIRSLFCFLAQGPVHRPAATLVHVVFKNQKLWCMCLSPFILLFYFCKVILIYTLY
jgi:hypothetical protein